MRFAAALALSLVGAALAAPAPIALQGDAKVMVGRDVTGLNPRVSGGQY